MSSEKKGLVRETNREQQRLCRVTWDPLRLKKESESTRRRMAQMRKRLAGNSNASSNVSPMKVFSSAQALGKALSRAKRVLPKSPRKKIALVKKLATDFGIASKSDNIRKKDSELEEQVTQFYHSDLVSRQLPGRKDYVTITAGDGSKERIQKRMLLSSVMEAYQLFKSDHPNKKIGKSKFASLRPKNVVPVSEKDHNVCCCRYHENFDLLLEGLRKRFPDVPCGKDLQSRAACDWCMKCYTGICDACSKLSEVVDQIIPETAENSQAAIEYYQWNGQNKKLLVNASVSEAKVELSSQLKVIKRHSFLAKVQLQQIKALKENITESEAVLQEDFSENFVLKQQNEIMSAHWLSESVTLFTAIINQSSGVSTSYVAISDALNHDKYSVFCFNQAIIESHLSSGNNEFTTLHVFSDGAASQFKNRFTLSSILTPSKIHKSLSNMDWSFFATAHGKGPVDGVGGTVKRAVWRRILQNRAVVTNAADFAHVARESCPNIRILFVSKDEVMKCKEKLDACWQQNPPITIHQLQQMHFVCARNSTLSVGLISPFISSLPVELQKAVPSTKCPAIAVHVPVYVPENDSSVTVPVSPEPTPTAEGTEATIGSYVVVTYEEDVYPGLIEDITESEYLVNVLHPCGGGWRWPTTKDAIWYPGFIKKIPAPTPANSRGVFVFEENLTVV